MWSSPVVIVASMVVVLVVLTHCLLHGFDDQFVAAVAIVGTVR